MDLPHKEYGKQGKDPTRFRGSDANTTYKLGSRICTDKTRDLRDRVLHSIGDIRIRSVREVLQDIFVRIE